MKLFSKIVKVFLTITLALTVIGLVVISILSSTVLNEAYFFRMLQSSNYYSNIYNEVQSNFENYIGPSGLDENILTDICTVEDIKKDTETILGNIFEGTEKSIDVSAMKEKIISKVNANLEGTKITSSMQESIDKFAQEISEEYKNTISHTDYESKINSVYNKGKKLVGYLKLGACVCIAIILILIVLLNLKQLNRTLANVGIAVTSSGAFYIIADFIVKSNVKVQNIKILNNSISTVLQNVIKDVLSQFLSVGIMLAVVGCVLILISNMIQAKNTEE